MLGDWQTTVLEVLLDLEEQEALETMLVEEQEVLEAMLEEEQEDLVTVLEVVLLVWPVMETMEREVLVVPEDLEAMPEDLATMELVDLEIMLVAVPVPVV